MEKQLNGANKHDLARDLAFLSGLEEKKLLRDSGYLEPRETSPTKDAFLSGFEPESGGSSAYNDYLIATAPTAPAKPSNGYVPTADFIRADRASAAALAPTLEIRRPRTPENIQTQIETKYAEKDLLLQEMLRIGNTAGFDPRLDDARKAQEKIAEQAVEINGQANALEKELQKYWNPWKTILAVPNKAGGKFAADVANAADMVDSALWHYGLQNLFGADLHEDSLVHQFAEWANEDNKAIQKFHEQNMQYGGPTAESIETYGSALLELLPDIVIAVMSGGTSEVPELAVAAESGLPTVLGKIAKDPAAQLAFVQSSGERYHQAIEAGASAERAILESVDAGLGAVARGAVAGEITQKLNVPGKIKQEAMTALLDVLMGKALDSIR